MMAFNKTSPRDLHPLCGEISPEDGMDPREFARKGRPRKGDRKDRQLCSQVAETLSLVLSGECDDEVLQSLQVVAVDPAPDASQLVVTVRAGMPDEQIDPDDAMERLTQIMGKLRCEVAGAITRKRAPKLLFRVL
jgi:ribosome-binding factor A